MDGSTPQNGRLGGLLKRGVKRGLRTVGLQVSRIRPPAPPVVREFTMEHGLLTARKLLGSFGTIIDVGASNGKWSATARRHFPEARIHMIEALREQERELQAVCERDRNMSFALAACGKDPGVTRFWVSDDLDGSGIGSDANDPNTREVAMTSIDSEIDRLGLKPPFLIKLDTHGFEVPILAGSSRALANTNCLIIEVYNYKLSSECLRYHELVEFMEKRGFRTFYMADPLNRLHDGTFWQMDLFFTRSDHPAFGYSRYQ